MFSSLCKLSARENLCERIEKFSNFSWNVDEMVALWKGSMFVRTSEIEIKV